MMLIKCLVYKSKVSRSEWKENIYVNEAGHIHTGRATPKIRDRVPVWLFEFQSSHVHYIADKLYRELLLVWKVLPVQSRTSTQPRNGSWRSQLANYSSSTVSKMYSTRSMSPRLGDMLLIQPIAISSISNRPLWCFSCLVKESYRIQDGKRRRMMSHWHRNPGLLS